jgi:hypothetical protein
MYYELIHALKLGGYSITEIENMLPYELEIFSAMHERFLKSIKQKDR